MRYPKFLQEGGTIGFVAPAFGCNMEPYKSAFENARKKFYQLGYETKEGPNCYEGSGIGISNTPKACADELMDYYESEENDVLISCGGGELMCEVLSHMDFERIRNDQPKWYMGYSDNTNFTFLSATLCDTAALYGPCAPAFGQEPWHPALQDAFDVLTGKEWTISGYDKYEVEGLKDEEHPLESYNVTEPCIRKAFPAGDVHMEGRLIGGCMDVLANLIGTRFDGVKEFNERYKEDGIIWFMEACDLNVFSIRRTLWAMKEAGWFEHVRGFLFGRPLVHGQEMFGLDQYNAVTDILGEYQVPILMDLDIGHIPPMMPLVLGSYSSASLTDNDFRITMRRN